jgi:hypothetical protein
MPTTGLIRALVLPVLVLVATTGAQKRTTDDAESRTTVTLPPATLSDQRHTGAFAAGKGLRAWTRR